MDCERVVFSAHAIRWMFQRRIDAETVMQVIVERETIAEYPDDTPYPSRVLLGVIKDRPIHVVVATEPVQRGACIVVTVYEPGIDRWAVDFKRRRQ